MRFVINLEKSTQTQGGGRWVTVKKEGPLQGRHIFIDGSGNVVKGKGVPQHIIHHLNSPAGKHHLEGAEDVRPEVHEPEQTKQPDEVDKDAKKIKVGDHELHVKDGNVLKGAENGLTMPFVRIHQETQKAPPGDPFAQKIEPHGEYMSHDSMDGKSRINAPNFEYGKVHFKNPLFIEHETTGHGGWKSKLSERFGGKTGKALSTAIKKAGHDGIVTLDSTRGEILETVNLAGVKSAHEDELNKSAEAEGRWVTVKAENSPIHGRHILIDGSGKILKGKGIPRHIIDHLNEKGGHGKKLEPHEMTGKEFSDLPENKGKHPENIRAHWLNSIVQAHMKHGDAAIPQRVFDATPWLRGWIDAGYKNPRPKKEKIAGEGFPFSKEQNEKNNEFLSSGSHLLDHGHGWGSGSGLNPAQKEFKHILHAEGYTAAWKYLTGRVNRDGFQKGIFDRMEQHMQDHMAKGEGLSAEEREHYKPAPKLPKYWKGPTDEEKHVKQFLKKVRIGDHVKMAQSLMDYLHGEMPEHIGDISDTAIVNKIDKDPDGPEWNQHILTIFNKEGTKILHNGIPSRARELKWHWRVDNTPEPKPEKKAMTPEDYDEGGWKAGFDWLGHQIKRNLSEGYKHRISEDAYGTETLELQDPDMPGHWMSVATRKRELNKSLTLKKGNSALVTPRKVAPVEVERADPQELEQGVGKYLTLYHVTPTPNVSSIKQSGLIPRYGKPTQGENPAYNAVYFHTDKDRAKEFDVGGDKTTLTIRIPINPETVGRLRPDEDTFHHNALQAISMGDGIAYCGHVPPEWIQ